MILGVCNCYTMAAIAVNRWYLIEHAQTYHRIFSKKRSLIMAAMVWLMSIMMIVPAVFGWTDIVYNTKTNACSYSRNKSRSFVIFLLGSSFGLPLLLITMAYGRLYLIVWRSKKKIAAMHSKDNEKAQGKAGKQTHALGGNRQTKNKTESENKTDKEMKLTWMLLTTVLVYLCLLGPYCALNIVDRESKSPKWMYILVTSVGYLGFAVNPLIYGFMNKQFKEAYAQITAVICLRKNKTLVQRINLDESVTMNYTYQ